MFVVVLIAIEGEKIKVCEVYDENRKHEREYLVEKIERWYKRFEELKDTYGGRNVCAASREVLGKEALGEQEEEHQPDRPAS